MKKKISVACPYCERMFFADVDIALSKHSIDFELKDKNDLCAYIPALPDISWFKTFAIANIRNEEQELSGHFWVNDRIILFSMPLFFFTEVKVSDDTKDNLGRVYYEIIDTIDKCDVFECSLASNRVAMMTSAYSLDLLDGKGPRHIKRYVDRNVVDYFLFGKSFRNVSFKALRGGASDFFVFSDSRLVGVFPEINQGAVSNEANTI